MRSYLTFLLLLAGSFTAAAQSSVPAKATDTGIVAIHAASYEKHNTIISFGIGFIDQYKSNYTLPGGFNNGKSSGFDPIYLKVEYGLSQHIGLAANFMYDGFYETYSQLYDNNGTSYPRYIKDNERAFSGGLLVYYHFRDLIPVRKLDIYIALGGSIYRIAHSNQPQTDTTVSKGTEHGAAPVAQLGIRYYINDKAAIFAEGGYDKASVFSIGFSCRFFRKASIASHQ